MNPFLDLPRVKVDGFGFLPDTREIVRRYTLWNINNATVRLITLGAGIQSITVPNKNGDKADVVIGFDTVEGYLENRFIGRIVGRETTPYKYKWQNSSQEKPSFDMTNWDSYVLKNSVVMTNLQHFGMDGLESSEAQPSTLMTQVKYTWTDENQLHVDISAVGVRPTPVNITSQCLFNLAGHGTGAKELLNHAVTINANKWAPHDLLKNRVLTGEIVNVNDTIYDLRAPTQLTLKRMFKIPGGGYNHNLCINTLSSETPYHFQGRMLHPRSGRYLEVYSNQPAIQLYTGNDFPEIGKLVPEDIGEHEINQRVPEKCNRIIGKDGMLYKRYCCFGLIPQGYPNALNNDNFPSKVLNPGKVYNHKIIYSFGVL